MEIWKKIEKYPYYEISNLGRVKSLARTVHFKKKFTRVVDEKIIKGCVDFNGYRNVTLSIDGDSKTVKIHQLVAIAFLNHNPCGFDLVVNHKDFNKQNNRLENLEIVTSRENINHKEKKGTSEYAGVSWDKKNKKWLSQINIGGIPKNLGRYNSEIEASDVYKSALKSFNNNEIIILKKPILTSKYKGVSWNRRAGKWKAGLIRNKKTYHLGYFKTELDAHNAYQNKLKNLIFFS